MPKTPRPRGPPGFTDLTCGQWEQPWDPGVLQPPQLWGWDSRGLQSLVQRSRACKPLLYIHPSIGNARGCAHIDVDTQLPAAPGWAGEFSGSPLLSPPRNRRPGSAAGSGGGGCQVPPPPSPFPSLRLPFPPSSPPSIPPSFRAAPATFVETLFCGGGRGRRLSPGFPPTPFLFAFIFLLFYLEGGRLRAGQNFTALRMCVI